MSSHHKHAKHEHVFWDERRGKIVSRIGGMVVGEAIYSHGYSMMDNLVGKASYFQVLVLSVTGHLPERRLADWLEALFICLSYPDARLWCNQAGSLAGSLGASPVAAVCAGVLASDSRMYGPGTQQTAVTFITAALEQKRAGLPVADFIAQYPRRPSSTKPSIPGYVRPLFSGDERIEALERVRQDLGFHREEHLTLAFEVEEIMQREYGERMNALGYATAFLCDQGFSAKEQYRIVSPMVQAGVLACYAEAADNPPHSFFPLRCADIEYRGKGPRPVPERENCPLTRHP